MGGRIQVEPNFNIGELENEDRLLAFREIEENNWVALKELTPKPIHNILEKIIAEYRFWSGQVLKIFKD